jgi:hypothetical protein
VQGVFPGCGGEGIGVFWRVINIMRNKKTSFYLLIILGSGFIKGLFEAMLAGGTSSAIAIIGTNLMLFAIPAIWFGCIIQLIAHARGKSQRALANGTVYYGAYIAIILFCIQMPLTLITALQAMTN